MLRISLILASLLVSLNAYEPKPDGYYNKKYNKERNPNARNTDRWGNTTPADCTPAAQEYREGLKKAKSKHTPKIS